MVDFGKWDGGGYSLIDIDTVPLNQQMDYVKRNNNVTEGFTLCPKCDGTGNEFFYKYRSCDKCDGSGRTEKIL